VPTGVRFPPPLVLQMTRLARGRATHLQREEIAVEALRQFDGGADPSLRQLAAALGVTPSAIYHHFHSRAAIIHAAVDLVWLEVVGELLAVVPEPLEADPVEVLVEMGVATRRAFGRHHRLATYMAAIPEYTKLRANTLALLANLFERMGMTPQQAADAFHAYASYTLGTTLFAAARELANEDLAAEGAAAEDLPRSTPDASLASRSRPETRAALDSVVDISVVDPDRDARLFAQNLRQLIQCWVTSA
jgi:TetR/AcrR family tetracycline transcriptional repressor